MQRSTNISIYAGPRQKRLATYHLEYILQSVLLNPKQYEQLRATEFVVDGIAFDLNKILDAQPDFEHIDFHQTQLDAYLTYCKEAADYNYGMEQIKSSSSHRHLHDAEKMALYQWTTGLHVKINLLLRENKWSSRCGLFVFLTTCIAARALSKSLHSPSSIEKAYRGQNGRFTKKDIPINKTLLSLQSGFTASDLSMPFAKQDRIIIHESPNSYNPLGKDIRELSNAYPEESEVLYPPNTEFIVTKIDHHVYSASPVRSINREAKNRQKKYDHGFSQAELANINRNYIKLQILNVANGLRITTKQLQHSFIRRIFDTVDNHAKQNCLYTVINALDASINTIDINMASIDELRGVIKTVIESHEKMVRAANASLGGTGALLESTLKQIEGLCVEWQRIDALAGIDNRVTEKNDGVGFTFNAGSN